MASEEPCPISDSMDFFNRKWILCILMDMFRGKKRFKEFKESNPTISNYILSQTLKYMEEKGLVSKIIENSRSRYELTPKGLKTNRILYELTIFSLDELECSKLSETKKEELFKDYKNSLGIGD